MSDLFELAKPIPSRYIGSSDKGMDAADHTVITQLLHLRVPGWSMEIREVLRSEVPEKQGKSSSWPGGMFVTGCIVRLSCVIDGTPVVVEEAGGVELASMKDGDGERLKHAVSDALKRCAMRIGLGLHIWAGENYFLDRATAKAAEASQETPEAAPEGVDADTGEIVDAEIVETVEASVADEWVTHLNKIADGRTRTAVKNRFGRTFGKPHEVHPDRAGEVDAWLDFELDRIATPADTEVTTEAF